MEISLSKYYLKILSPIIFFILTLAFFRNNFLILVYFLLFGLFGMAGEVAISFLWDIFYPQKFWGYQVQTLFKKYSSLLNLAPWGLGGFIYWFCFIKWPFIYLDFINSQLTKEDLAYTALIFFVSQFLVLAIRCLWVRSFKSDKFEFKKVNLFNLFYFFLPFLASLGYLIVFIDSTFLPLFMVAGFIAFIFEYLFGKICYCVLGHSLWVYNYSSFDNKHITFLSIPFFIEGAFYFFWVGEFIKILF